ncbi:pilus assembly protein PilM [Candidatus Babeliales bacterium]|nr:pilus assembly protein PilM [Candidatus Babeliales bacterium]
MIKKIFFPAKVGSRRLYPEYILGVSIDEHKVYGALVYAKSSQSSIENLFEQDIEKQENNTQEQATAQALKKLVSSIKNYDQLNVAIPSSIVVFKELEVPFIDEDKIRMVLEYEIEEKLPFSVNDAVVDFIITKKNKSLNTSQILVAAVRNQDLQSIIDIYTAADIAPHHITIDLFALYGLYLQMPEFNNNEETNALIELDLHSSRISLIHHNELRMTRHVPRGIATVAQEVSKEINMPIEKTLEKLFKFGLKPTGDDAFDKSLQQHMINFFYDIQFTLNSFSLKLTSYKGINKLLFCGQAVTINNLMRFCGDLLQLPCIIFDPSNIFTNKSIKKKRFKQETIEWHEYATVLGVALVPPAHEHFDLRRKKFELIDYSLIKKQLVAGFVLMLVLFTTISVQGYFQINALATTANDLESHEIGKIIDMIPRQDRPRTKQLNPVIARAEKVLNEKIELWAPFKKERIQPLEILLELTSIMDNKLFMIDVEGITIDTAARGSDTLKVEVDGYFKSKKGTGSHFAEFTELQRRFDSSNLLKPAKYTEHPAGEKGIQFNVELKKHDEAGEEQV